MELLKVKKVFAHHFWRFLSHCSIFKAFLNTFENEVLGKNVYKSFLAGSQITESSFCHMRNILKQRDAFV